jgi:hypothetical protein
MEEYLSVCFKIYPHPWRRKTSPVSKVFSIYSDALKNREIFFCGNRGEWIWNSRNQEVWGKPSKTYPSK